MEWWYQAVGGTPSSTFGCFQCFPWCTGSGRAAVASTRDCSKMSLLVRLYVTTLNRHPWKTQALTTGINLLFLFTMHIAALGTILVYGDCDFPHFFQHGSTPGPAIYRI